MYPWRPKNQIWIEKDIHPSELLYIIAHEYTELRLMRDCDFEYDEAHAICSKVEFDLRWRRPVEAIRLARFWAKPAWPADGKIAKLRGRICLTKLRATPPMPSILYLAPVEWSSPRQRPQHLARRLADWFDVRYVDPVGLRSARLSDLARIWRRVRPASRPAVDDCPPSVIRPRYLPWLGRRPIDRFNLRWLMRQMEAYLPNHSLQAQHADASEGDPWILWLGAPSLLARALVERTQPNLIVYDCMDRYAAFHRGRTRRRIEADEAQLVARADLVFASSRGLAERLDAWHETDLVPNGVDLAAFSQARRDRPPCWLAGLRGPVVGFHGMLGNWIDFDLLARLAERHRDWSWVFIGPGGNRASQALGRLPNVRFVGEVNYADLPRQAVWFDAGIVPFRLNDLTRHVHPIKALEYLALGLPVVATPLPDLAPFASVASFASTDDQWSEALSAALGAEARGADQVAARRRAVAGHDWQVRAGWIAERLMERLAAQRRTAPATSVEGGRQVQLSDACRSTGEREMLVCA